MSGIPLEDIIHKTGCERNALLRPAQRGGQRNDETRKRLKSCAGRSSKNSELHQPSGHNRLRDVRDAVNIVYQSSAGSRKG
jgi:hypothetical protein